MLQYLPITSFFVIVSCNAFLQAVQLHGKISHILPEFAVWIKCIKF